MAQNQKVALIGDFNDIHTMFGGGMSNNAGSNLTPKLANLELILQSAPDPT